MYLKSLTIVGFKTFPDETVVVFDPGFTSVVGPNGSGKSNIVDAIRWVMGERSAKGLRGDKMEDVIFHGSEMRKPAGFAEASIVLDNTDKKLSLDFPTVKITRRLYPDLTNEYYINDSRVARKDVEKMLMDTGLGKLSYSIMEQGKVEAILNAKPEERRAIFDEAAGISKFKLERQETLKKLEQTNQNLLRITDIMSSMEKELSLKEKQAEKTRAYFQLKSDLTEVDKNIRYLKSKTLKNKLKKAENELNEVRTKNNDLMQKLNTDKVLIESLETERVHAEKKISEIDKKLFDFVSKKEVQKEKIEKNKSIIEEYNQRIEEQSLTLSAEKSKLESIDNEISELIESINNLEKEIHFSRDNIQVFLNQRIDIEQKIEEESKKIESNQNKITENDKEHSNIRENLKSIIVSLIEQIERIKQESMDKESFRDDLKQSLLLDLEKYINTIEILKQNYPNITQPYLDIEPINLVGFKEKLYQFLSIEDLFRSILFDKDGMLSQKEFFDQKIEDLILENDKLSRNIKESFEVIDKLRLELDEKKEEIVSLEKKILEMESKKTSSDESIHKLKLNRQEVSTRMETTQVSITSLKNKRDSIHQEIQKLEHQIEESYKEFLGMSKSLESEKTELQAILDKIQEMKNNSHKDQEEFQNLIPLLSELERRSSALKVQFDTFIEELYNDYSITENELDAEKSSLPLKQETEESKLRKVKSEIQLLGNINPLAIDEYNQIKEIFDHHKSQKADIEQGKLDILEVMRNIDIESVKLFIEAFDIIRNNFQETFTTLFNGGRASIELTEKTDPLNSGIEIIAEPPGKHVQNMKLLSGGEKALTVVALLFAIYMLKPSPFCFLDEIDAPLDETNKIRFCQILDKFKSTTQFIVITHAPTTISRSNTIFGVTNEEPGISKIVSLKFEEVKHFTKKMKEAV